MIGERKLMSSNGNELNKSEATRRPDGRKALLVYLDPELILTLKRMALEDDRHVYLLVEDLLKEGLQTPKG